MTCMKPVGLGWKRLIVMWHKLWTDCLTDQQMDKIDIEQAFCVNCKVFTVESFIFAGLKFRGFQISDKLVGI